MNEGAKAERRRQFRDIDQKIDRVLRMVDHLKSECRDLPDDNWKFTGRGSDLARIQHDLAVVLSEGDV